MSDSYHTMGAAKDRARTWALKEREIKALERIATALEAITKAKDKEQK